MNLPFSFLKALECRFGVSLGQYQIWGQLWLQLGLSKAKI